MRRYESCKNISGQRSPGRKGSQGKELEGE